MTGGCSPQSALETTSLQLRRTADRTQPPIDCEIRSTSPIWARAAARFARKLRRSTSALAQAAIWRHVAVEASSSLLPPPSSMRASRQPGASRTAE
eukprot:scaffold73313_cov27-Tisochrysis_lutea.AAC.4